MKKIAAIVQARMTSTRLPKKIMLDLAGKPVIEQVFKQLSYSKFLNEIILATSNDKSDDILEKWAKENKIKYFRGSLDNVLERFYKTAKKFRVDIVVRITADCPLIDPQVVDSVIEGFLKGNYDYFSNINPPTFPDGLDTEVFTFKALKKAFNEAQLKSELEHVTPYIRNHPELFKIGNLYSLKDYSYLRWTLDNKEDYMLISKIYNELYNESTFISWQKVVKYLEINKDLLDINAHIKRNEGYIKSLKEDKNNK